MPAGASLHDAGRRQPPRCRPTRQLPRLARSA